MLDQSLVSGSSFRDDKNFPHGFSRSGNFSRNESNLLTQGGRVAMMLASGEMLPSTDAQSQFLEVCRGERTPETEFERVWLKYKNVVARKRNVFSFASSGNLAATEGRVYDRDLIA